MIKKNKQIKNIFSIILIILFLDLIFFLTRTTTPNLKLLAFNLGFTLLILTTITSIIIQFRKLKMTEGIIIGGISLAARGALSFPVATLFGGVMTYNLYFIVISVAGSLVQGIGYGAFAFWLSKKVVK